MPNLLDQLRAHFDWLDQMLPDDRTFLQGQAPSLADLAAYHPIWFLKQNFGSTPAPLDGFPRLLIMGRPRFRYRVWQAKPNDLPRSARCSQGGDINRESIR